MPLSHTSVMREAITAHYFHTPSTLPHEERRLIYYLKYQVSSTTIQSFDFSEKHWFCISLEEQIPLYFSSAPSSYGLHRKTQWSGKEHC